MTPFRRWLLRSFFLTLLLLGAAGWAVSTRYHAWGGYARDGTGLTGRVNSGGVGFAWMRDASDDDGWEGELTPHSFQLVGPDFWWYCKSYAGTGTTGSSFGLVGFYYSYYSLSQAPDPPTVQYAVGVPFWFLLLVSGAALWWAWRKTAPSPTERTGFPVEPAPPSASPPASA